MKQGTYNYYYSILIVLLISIIWSCTPQRSYTVKSFLFDGVPDPLAVEHKSVVDTLEIIENTITDEITPRDEIISEFFIHKPYKNRECFDCHDRNNMGKTKLPTPQLCNLCHQDFNAKYTVVHGPAVSGSCTECHEPHQSKLNHLLKQSSPELCFNCHESTFIEENIFHKEIKNPDCTICHDPHGGNDNFILKSGNCYRCHENYESKFKFLHGPVGSENCSACHATHGSNNYKQLIKSGDQLCLDCHNSEEIFSCSYNQEEENKNCIDCHDPHGGANYKLLLN